MFSKKWFAFSKMEGGILLEKIEEINKK